MRHRDGHARSSVPHTGGLLLAGVVVRLRICKGPMPSAESLSVSAPAADAQVNLSAT